MARRRSPAGFQDRGNLLQKVDHVGNVLDDMRRHQGVNRRDRRGGLGKALLAPHAVDVNQVVQVTMSS